MSATVRRPSFLTALPLCAGASLLLCTPAAAEIARLGQWAVNADLTVSSFYDSNPNIDNSGVSTFGFTADPVLKVQRFGSATRAEGTFHFTPTLFTSRDVDNQTDASADFYVAHPYTDDQLAKTEARATVKRATYANSSVGDRITSNSIAGSLTQRISRADKLGLLATASGRAVNYTDSGLSNNREASVSLAARYQRTPLSEFTLGLSQTYGLSLPDDPTRQDRRLKETAVLVGANGRLTPQILSDLYVGFGWARYRGGYVGRSTQPVAGGGIQWSATAKTTLRAELDAGSDFSPEGSAERNLRIRLEASTRLRESWLVAVGPSWRRARIEEGSGTRRDTQLGAHARLAYTPSERFNVAWALEAYTQDSNVARRDYDRVLNTLSSSYRF